MFALEQPSMALNDTRSPVIGTMKVNKTIQPDEGVSQVLGYVVNAASQQPGGRLKNLIFFCHGNPAELEMGNGIDISLTNRFSMLAPGGKPLVDYIYFHSCLVARIGGSDLARDGNIFCSEIARYAKCIVVASTAVQQTGCRDLPYGMLDKFEGTELHYGPRGNVLTVIPNPKFDKWSFDND